MRRERCPACNNRQHTTLCDVSYVESPLRDYLQSLYSEVGPGVEFKFLEGAHYNLVECTACGLIYQAEVPGDIVMHKLYTEWLNPEIIKRNAGQRQIKQGLFMAMEIARAIQYTRKVPAQVKFLDFGMGWGNWCLVAKAFGCDVYGLELGEDNLNHARTLGIKEVSLNDLTRYRFDVINAEQVFEHLAQPLETLKTLSSVLVDGGIIRINVPQSRDFKRRLKIWDWQASLTQDHKNSLNDGAPLQHINVFIGRSMIAMGKAAGMTAIEAHNLNPVTRRVSPLGAVKSMFWNYLKTQLPGISARRKLERLSRTTNQFFVKV